MRAPRTLPTRLMAARPAPAVCAAAAVTARASCPAASAADRHGALRPRCGGAATALRRRCDPAPGRQTGRGESWATRAPASPGGAAAAAATSSRTTAAHVATHTHQHHFCVRGSPHARGRGGGKRGPRWRRWRPRRCFEKRRRPGRGPSRRSRRCARGSACEHRSSPHQHQRAASGMGRKGAKFEFSRRLLTLASSLKW